MNLPFAVDSAQDAFFRASLRLTCCEPMSSDAVIAAATSAADAETENDAHSWVGKYAGRLASSYIPGYQRLTQRGSQIYGWLQALSLVVRGSATGKGSKSWSKSHFL